MGIRSPNDTTNNCHIKIFSNFNDQLVVRVRDYQDKDDLSAIFKSDKGGSIVLKNVDTIIVKGAGTTQATIYLEKDSESKKSFVKKVRVIHSILGITVKNFTCYPALIGDGSTNTEHISNSGMSDKDNAKGYWMRKVITRIARLAPAGKALF